MLATLRQRNFGLLWAGGLISLIGDRALLIALPFYVFQRTGSTLATAGMFAAFYLPMVLFGSVAGVFADRWDRKRLMVTTNIIQAVVVLLLLFVRSEQWLWLVYPVLFLSTSVAMFFHPAENALLPQLVDDKRLVTANALNALNNNIARLAGPPIGGLLMGLIGLPGIALVDGASFLIAALLISRISVPPVQTAAPDGGTSGAAPPPKRVWADWVEGLQLVRHDRMIAALFTLAAITSFGGAMFDPLIAPWVGSVLHGDTTTVGWLSTAGAIGGLIGGMILGRWGHRIRPARLFALGNIVAGLMLLALYNQVSLPAVLAIALLMNIPLVGSAAGLSTLLQTSVPDPFRGRVYGALSTTIAVLGLAALGLSGFLGEVIGIVPMLSVAAIITLLSGALALILLREGDRRPVAYEAEDSEPFART